MDQFNLFGTIKEGKISITNRHALEEWTKLLPEGENLIIKVNIQKSYKSYRQLRLLYHCFRTIAFKTGQSVEDIKLILKLKAGLCFSHVIEGESLVVCKSISDFSKIEISDFIQFINEWSINTLSLPLLTDDDKSFLKSI